jgi:hypothetical protein
VSANGLRHEFLMSANDRKCQRRLLAMELLSHVLPEKASSDQEHHQLLLVVTGEEMRPKDRVSAARPAVRAARRV